ncbi:TIGR02996 domain-containing protein [Myxococcus sp. K38C18041901]|uniref:TIGR02996 domain-containing protein n=1 Tax=Myxococcus guangdongensis TaxID=2906760 RepID=UPI0020A7EA8B|nr:TIGR02996 domain-containing protein [Myxococcus guangdongensis]MCP3060106.1 TIGR02996 domain-containing protein [Myxococcus guangdongensis]
MNEADGESRSASIREQWLPRVYANPEDDGVRLVMADQLLETGDPLGEFIVLQCAAAPDPARIDALLARHGRRWELPLGDLIERGATRFERGLPVAVRMSRDAARLIPAEPGPAWCTVRELDWAVVPWSVVHGQWLAHPHLRGVTRMRGVEPFWARLMGQPPSVHRLELCGPIGPQTRGRTAPADVFDILALLPNLSWLELRDADADDVRLCASSKLATKPVRFDAILRGHWALTVNPGGQVPMEATLVSERAVGTFERVLRAAEGFGPRGLRVRCEPKLDATRLQRLRRAASGFSRVEWV